MDVVKQETPKKRWVSKGGMEIVHELLTSQFESGFKQCAIMKTIDSAEQARRLPRSFVGESAYLYMCEARNQKDMAGDYRIVFARTGARARTISESYKPSIARKLTIRTDIRKTGQGTYANHLLREGCWGAIELRFDQYVACIGLEAPARDGDFDVPARVAFQEVKPKKDSKDENYADRAGGIKLERILAMGINDTGDNRAYFGIKDMDDRESQNYSNTVLGFRFVELEVIFMNRDTGKRDHLVIVAVKLDDEVKDVGSPFILAQKVYFPDSELYDFHRY